jgi:hypothetical protein
MKIRIIQRAGWYASSTAFGCFIWLSQNEDY